MKLIAIAIAIFYVYQTISYIFLQRGVLDISYLILRFGIMGPLTVLLVYFVFRKPFRKNRKSTRYFWYFIVATYAIVLAIISVIVNILCSQRVLTAQRCGTRQASNVDFYAIIGPYIFLLFFVTNRLAHLVTFVLYIVLQVIDLILGPSQPLLGPIVSLVYLIGGYALALAINYQYEMSNRNRFLLRTGREREFGERRAAEERQRVVNEEKEQFVSYIFHEIRGPLNIIALSLGLLSRDKSFVDGMNPTQVDFYARIKNGVQAMQNVMEDTVDYTKMSRGDISIVTKPFNLLQTLDDLLWAMRSSWDDKRIAFEKSYDPDFPQQVIGDANRLRQVTANYLSNAVKFTPLEGKIHFTVQIEELTDDHVKFVVNVKDSGIGISPENQSKLFRPFVQIDPEKTQKGKGTGLGLSIVATIIGKMGGQYGVESKVGQGSLFYYRLSLPISKETVGLEPEETEVSEEYVPPLYILVVDDEDVTRKIVTRIFRSLGHRTDEATNGRECIEKVQANSKQGTDFYDIVFIDNLMPVMSGAEAIRWLRAHGYDVPIVSFTSTADSEGQTDLFKSGSELILVKPASLPKIQQVLQKFRQRILERRRQIAAGELR